MFPHKILASHGETDKRQTQSSDTYHGDELGGSLTQEEGPQQQPEDRGRNDVEGPGGHGGWCGCFVGQIAGGECDVQGASVVEGARG